MSIVYQDLIELEAPPETVREFIVTPERILDYYPGGIEGGVIEPGAAIYCRSEASVSLLQVDQAASTPDTLVLDVFTGSQGFSASHFIFSLLRSTGDAIRQQRG